MKRTAIYMRVSTATQASEGISLDAQRALLLDYINSHSDLVLVGEYMDDGVSGTKFDQRDELQRLLKDVEEGKIDLVIFTKLDRFFRSVRHLMNTLDTLEKHNVEWNAITEHHDNTTPTGRLSLTIMGAFAEMEADMDSQRIKEAMNHKKNLGEWLNASVPFGYTIVNKHAVPDPEKAEIARAIFRDYLKHNSIMQLLRDYGPLGAPHSHKGMKDLLERRVYIGEVHGITDYVEPIIDKETFDNVQRLIKKGLRYNPKRVYLFSGLAICPVCGRKMTCGHTGGYKSLRCNHYKQGQCTYKRAWSERKLERFLLDTYKEELEKRHLQLKAIKNDDNSAKISALYRKIDRLKELYVNELIDLETYKADREKYRAEINALETPPEVNTERIEALLKLNVYDIYHTLKDEQKRRLWRSVIDYITEKDGSFFVQYL